MDGIGRISLWLHVASISTLSCSKVDEWEAVQQLRSSPERQNDEYNKEPGISINLSVPEQTLVTEVASRFRYVILT